MRAQIRNDAHGNIIVHMEGGLDFENTVPFREKLEYLTKEHPASTITLDLNQLDFVGSSGIGHFVETINSLNRKKDQIRISNVTNEFIRVFKLYDMNFMDIIIQEFESDETEFLGQKFANRSKTYQN